MSLMEVDHPAASEPAIPFPNLSKWIAREYGTKAPHVSTLHRWRLSGVHGVAMPTFLLGGKRYVRPADVRSFIEALNG